MDTVGVAAQGVNCYDNCNTGCAGLPSKEYQKCDKKCHKRCGDAKIMMKKKMNTVAAMAMVLMILLSANMDTASVAAQGVNCYDNCNTACVSLPPDEYMICDKKCHEIYDNCPPDDCAKCREMHDNCNTGYAGLPSDEYLICDKKCHEMCGDEGKIDGNLDESAKKY